MLKSKLILALKTLSKKELKRFAEFVRSPYFNKHKEVTLLADYLITQAPTFTTVRKTQKEYIYNILFPQKAYDDNYFASIINKLLKLLEAFFVVEQQENDEEQKAALLLKALRTRKLTKHHHTYQKKIQKLIFKKNRVLDKQAFLEYKYHQEMYAWSIEQNIKTDSKMVELTSNQLDVYYWIERMQIACEMVSRDQQITTDYDYRYILMIEHYLKKETAILNKYPLLNIYLIIFNLIKAHTNNNQYLLLKREFEKNAPQIHFTKQKTIYNYLLNYCIYQTNSGNYEYYQETLYWYKSSLRKGLIYINGYLPTSQYTNIITVALRIKKFDWTKSFIEEYKERLPPKEKTNCYLSNLATLYYEEKKYDEVLGTVQNIKLTDTNYYMRTKLLQLKVYYELSEWTALGPLLESFNTFLNRYDEKNGAYKNMLLNMIFILKKLYRLKTKKVWMEKEKFNQKYLIIQQELENHKSISNKTWLCEKLLELQ